MLPINLLNDLMTSAVTTPSLAHRMACNRLRARLNHREGGEGGGEGMKEGGREGDESLLKLEKNPI